MIVALHRRLLWKEFCLTYWSYVALRTVNDSMPNENQPLGIYHWSSIYYFSLIAALCSRNYSKRKKLWRERDKTYLRMCENARKNSIWMCAYVYYLLRACPLDCTHNSIYSLQRWHSSRNSSFILIALTMTNARCLNYLQLCIKCAY